MRTILGMGGGGPAGGGGGCFPAHRFLLALTLLLVPRPSAEDFSAWTRHAELRLDPARAGIALAADVADFPLLVRLDSGRFDFAAARPDGADLRFSDADGAILPHQVEGWDAAGRRAEVWVRAPLVRMDGSGSIRMHWGNPVAARAEDARAVFDSARGFAGVWHLSGDVLEDASGVAGAGVATRAVRTAGLIGEGRALQGNNQGIVVPASPGLSVAAGLTVSAWIRPASWSGSGARIAQKGAWQLYQEGDSLVWSLSGAAGDLRVKAALPGLGAWSHVAGTWDGSVSRLYVGGVPAASAPAPAALRDTADELCLGCRAIAGKPHGTLEGVLDEASVSRVARSADWIRLAHANQRAQQTFPAYAAAPGCVARFGAPADTTVPEDGRIRLAGLAECADGFSWSAVEGATLRILDPEVKVLDVAAPRVSRDTSLVLRFTARFGDSARSRDVRVRLREAIPDPQFSLNSVPAWNGRDPLAIRPVISNLAAVKASRDSALRYAWTLEGLETDTALQTGALVLRSASSRGVLGVTLCLDNGGPAACRALLITVEPPVGLRAPPLPASGAAVAPLRDALGRRQAPWLPGEARGILLPDPAR